MHPDTGDDQLDEALLSVQPVEQREGIVISCGDGVAKHLASVLAAATSRDHVSAAPDDVESVIAAASPLPTALVGSLEDIGHVGTWPGFFGERVGVLTGTTGRDLARLALRTIAGPRAVQRTVLATGPTGSRAFEADALSLDELVMELEVGPAQTAFIESHGRECCVNLPGGMICGLDAANVQLPLVPGTVTRLPPCLQGDGCYREGLLPHEFLTAQQIDADLIVVESCNAISLGVNSEPLAVSVTLRMLQGTCRAVIGAVGNHAPHPDAYPTLRRLLHEGLPLGDILAQLNRMGTAVVGPFGRLGLLGDPGLVLALGPAKREGS